MKTILLFLILISTHVFAQSDYTVDKNATIYAVPGGELLTAAVKNDTIFVKHIAANGELIWEDALFFAFDFSPIRLSEIVRINNTNEYIISAYYDYSPTTNPFLSTNDTMVYQFSKLNLTDHTFQGNYINTYYDCFGVSLVEYKDNSTYVFISHYNDSNIYNREFTTYELNSEMDINLVAPKDSLVSLNRYWVNVFYDDTLYRYHRISVGHTISKFTADIRHIETHGETITTNQNQNIAFFRKIINKDSLFVFTYGRVPSKIWKMNWLDLSLNTLNSVEISSPLVPYYNTYTQFELDFVEIDRVNKRILVMASKDNAPLSFDDPQRIFVYDYNFNFVCEIPVRIGNINANSLISLHNRVYLRVSDYNDDKLYEVGCNLLNAVDLETNFHVELYPNPATSTIYVSNPELKILTVECITTDGKHLLKMIDQSDLITIDINDFPAGIYLIKISDGIHTSINRFTKL